MHFNSSDFLNQILTTCKTDQRRLLSVVLLLCLINLLSACGLLVVGAAGGVAVALNDPRPTSVMLDDESIERKATDLIYQNTEVAKKIHINVTSYNYVVVLTGEVLNTDLRQYVVEVVRKIKNVRRVHNETSVMDLSTFSSRSADTLTTTKVKTRMLATKGFDATQIKVVTERATVYLMGLVTHEHGNKAAEIASHVEGVARVIKLFEYSDQQITRAPAGSLLTLYHTW